MDWEALLAQRMETPFQLGMSCDEDVSQFDRKFTELTLIDSPVDVNISESADLNFQGFLYVAPSLVEEVDTQSRSQRKGLMSPRLKAPPHYTCNNNDDASSCVAAPPLGVPSTSGPRAHV